MIVNCCACMHAWYRAELFDEGSCTLTECWPWYQANCKLSYALLMPSLLSVLHAARIPYGLGWYPLCSLTTVHERAAEREVQPNYYVLGTTLLYRANPGSEALYTSIAMLRLLQTISYRPTRSRPNRLYIYYVRGYPSLTSFG